MSRTILLLASLLFLLAACNNGSAVVEADLPETGPDKADGLDAAFDLSEPEEVYIQPGDVATDLPDLAEEELPACETGSGCFGDPCTDANDCLSGLCVDHMGDQICTQTCVEECPAGFVCQEVAQGGSDPFWACISQHPRLCRPCHNDADCVSLSGHESACVVYPDEGSFCASPCAAGMSNVCPLGFTCDFPMAVSGVQLEACIHDAGVCPCSETAIALALSTPCRKSNEFGTCEGLRVCSETGLTECDAPLPAAEICNGIDDDCDGITDTGSCDDGNPCTQDGCDPAAGCFHQPLTDTDCDDGNDCTLGDHCQAGECVGTTVECNDGNPCTDDLCDPATGCKFVNGGGPCDDGDSCTFGDFCDDGACHSGVTLTCDDGNPCTEDSCDGEAGCLHDPLVGDCDDDNPCTTGDHCAAGKCVPGGLLPCNDDNPCTDDWCDPNSGCTFTPNESACDDGNICTLGDTCGNGECLAGTALNCDDSNPCTNDTCNPLVGCKHTNNTAACNDQDPCTVTDQCVGGACVGIGALDCDDGNPCTKDFCDPMAGCTHGPSQGACDDGNPCTWGDTCQAGSCVGGQQVTCDDGNVCTDDACDPQSGCTHTANSKPCDDLNQCTTDDHCTGGQCVSNQAVSCNDDNPCTTDFCLPDGGCQFVFNTQPCNDGDPCTAGDTCADGACQPGTAVQCNDGNPCTADSCQDGLCQYLPQDGACDDDNPCTLNDQCGGGKCLPGVALNCDDDDLCTTDYCDPKVGCVHSLNTVPCDDGDACTIGDECQLGQCQAGTPLNCDDGNPCTQSACANGQCIHAPIEGACDDGNPCTTGDHCAAGLCVPEAMTDCNDDNPCTQDACQPLVGCTHAPAPGACDDGNACTAGDTCQEGSCVGGDPVNCTDGDPCTADDCDPDQGCIYPDADDGTPCDDGSNCTLTDTCSAGQCVGADPLDCDDGDACTEDGCDPVDGCLHTALTPCCGNGQVEGGEECDDGNTTPGDGCDAQCQDEVLNSPECQNYVVLDNWQRHVSQNDGNGGVESCDNTNGSWYRFMGDAGTQMPTSCPPKYSCGTDAPGWMNGSYPPVEDGIVNRTVCFHWDSGCCTWSTTIQVRNCGPYYVFKLPDTPACSLMYCGQ